MPAVAISHRGAQSSPWTRTPSEDIQKIPGPYPPYPRISYRATYLPREDSWDLLRPGPALSAMRNLKNLHIKVFHENIAEDILINCPFQLVSFLWIFHVAIGRLRRILEFLANQRDIRCLGSSIPKVLFTGPLALPACEHLEQEAIVAPSRFPSRSQGYITHLDS